MVELLVGAIGIVLTLLVLFTMLRPWFRRIAASGKAAQPETRQPPAAAPCASRAQQTSRTPGGSELVTRDRLTAQLLGDLQAIERQKASTPLGQGATEAALRAALIGRLLHSLQAIHGQKARVEPPKPPTGLLPSTEFPARAQMDAEIETLRKNLDALRRDLARDPEAGR